MVLNLNKVKSIIKDFEGLSTYEAKKAHYDTLRKSVKVRPFWESVFYYVQMKKIPYDKLDCLRVEKVENLLSTKASDYTYCISSDLKLSILNVIDKCPLSTYDIKKLIQKSKITNHSTIEKFCLRLNEMGLCSKEKYGFREDNRGWKFSISESQQSIINILTGYTKDFLNENKEIDYGGIVSLINVCSSKSPTYMNRLPMILSFNEKADEIHFLHELASSHNRCRIGIDKEAGKLAESDHLKIDYFYNKSPVGNYFLENSVASYISFLGQKIEECRAVEKEGDFEALNDSLMDYIQKKQYNKKMVNLKKKSVKLTKKGKLACSFFNGMYEELKKEIPSLEYYS